MPQLDKQVYRYWRPSGVRALTVPPLSTGQVCNSSSTPSRHRHRWPSLRWSRRSDAVDLRVGIRLSVVAKSKGSDIHAVASRALRGMGPEEKAAVLNVFDVDRDGRAGQLSITFMGVR